MKTTLIKIVFLLFYFLLPDCTVAQAQPKDSNLSNEITIENLVIEGSTITPKINSILSPYLNQTIPLREVSTIQRAINQFYQNQGYLSSYAIIPLQNFEDGIVKIQVIESRISQIKVKSNSHLSDNYIKARLKKSLNSVPLKLETLETELRLLQQNPLIERVKAEIRPDLELGYSLLFLTIKESPTTTISLSADNDQSPSSGESRATLAIERRSLLLGGDLIKLQSSFSEGLEKYQINYDIPLNSADGMLSLNYENNQSDIVEEPFDDLDINGDVKRFSLSYRQPLFRSSTKEWTFIGNFDITTVNSFLFGDLPFSFTPGAENGFYKISALRWGFFRQTRSTSEVLILGSFLNVGLDIFGATHNNNLPDGQFVTWQSQARWIKAFGDNRNTQLVVNCKAQLTPDELLPSEQFVMGGIDSVRGYRQNLLIADNGFSGSIEGRIPLFDSQSIGLLQLTPFFDIGTVWNNQSQEIESGTLASLGLGLRWILNDFLQANFNYGVPLIAVKKRGNSLSENGWHFEVRVIPIRF
ncbi:MAG: ShlB/FhaC/HecB family hemolysin secretion/activation protein [Xenococcaceae cyanobacterium MO_234.B1]|nr:ShlB/FhaC/HecB family hemolysin secretion/activation protein [Xenococcaceae cyanobacterium MO_234.B1]